MAVSVRASCRLRSLRQLSRCTIDVAGPIRTTSAAHHVRSRWNSSAAAEKKVTYTADSYPELKRDPRFAKLDSSHIDHFKSIVGESAVIDGTRDPDATEDLASYNEDWMRKYRGQSRLVLKPGSTAEVSQILKYCSDNTLAVVPQGGNTGLVGGSVPVFDEVVLSTSRMNKIRSFDPVSGALVLDAGVILEVADKYLADRGHIFPLDLGAKGSCQVGGNVATNAGGLRLLRYGSLHGSVLGLEAVLPDGTVADDLGTLRKNNTGYDIKQLFVGAEGTIGVVTAVSVLCPPRPAAVNVTYFGLGNYQAVQRAFVEARRQLGEILSAFELVDAGSQELVARVTGKQRPLEGQHPFSCLVETSGSDGEHDAAKLERFLERVMEDGVVEDGVLAQDETQARALWSWREGVPESLGHWGGVYKYDVSLPVEHLYALVEDTREKLVGAGLVGDSDDHPALDVVGYGHMGDANLHLNVPVRRYDKAVERELEPFVYEWIAKHKGSISAEHGLGLQKKPYVGYSRSQTMIGLMRQIKNLYDPKGIMNPYKYI